MKLRTSHLLTSTRNQTIAIVLASLVIGFGTYLYLINYQANIERENSLVPVYVASSQILSGTSFEEIRSRNLVTRANFPKDSIPNTAITALASVEGSLKSKGVLEPGQIILSSYFQADARTDVSLKIPQGMLAVTISVDDVSRVGNFVLPGSRVVLFATGSGSSGTVATKILIPNTLVLGIGNQTDLNTSTLTLNPSPLVTIAVTPRDAQKVILAAQSMKLSLALAYNNDPESLLLPISRISLTEISS